MPKKDKDLEAKILKLAKKAGFVIWGENDWNPERIGKIDWSCEYDNELYKLYILVRKDVLKELETINKQ